MNGQFGHWYQDERDVFALHAMASLIQAFNPSVTAISWSDIARDSYDVADAMLTERKRRNDDAIAVPPVDISKDEVPY